MLARVKTELLARPRGGSDTADDGAAPPAPPAPAPCRCRFCFRATRGSWSGDDAAAMCSGSFFGGKAIEAELSPFLSTRIASEAAGAAPYPAPADDDDDA